MKVEIVDAKPRDATSLSRIAHAAKRHWGYPERWIRQWSDILTITPELIRSSFVFSARSNGRTLGFGALNVCQGKPRLDHLWVLPNSMGRGIGRRLFEHAMAVAASNQWRRVEIEADPNAEPFYKKMGARRIGQTVTTLEGEKRILPILRVNVFRWMEKRNFARGLKSPRRITSQSRPPDVRSPSDQTRSPAPR